MSESESENRQQQEIQARHVHAFLRTAIVFGTLAAGTAITIRALVRRHQVSATAARRALLTLEDEGLVSREGPDEARVSDRKRR